MSRYEFFIAGRWRNQDAIRAVLDAVRASGRTAYCFIDNDYRDDTIQMAGDPDAFMRDFEALPLDHPFLRATFERDMAAQRAAAAFLVVLPAGTSAHIEAGVAYGLGQKCYAVGQPAKPETLYGIFERIFPDVAALAAWLA